MSLIATQSFHLVPNAGVCARAAASAALVAAMERASPPRIQLMLRYAISNNLEGAATHARELLDAAAPPCAGVLTPAPAPPTSAPPVSAPPVHGGLWRRPSLSGGLGGPGPRRATLHDAVSAGDAATCVRLLAEAADAGAAVDARAPDGTTPLWAAVAHGHVEAARVLLAGGASFWRACGGETVLQLSQRLYGADKAKDDTPHAMIALLRGAKRAARAKSTPRTHARKVYAACAGKAKARSKAVVPHLAF